MTTLNEFIASAEKQDWFAPDDGDIVNVQYVRIYKDSNDRPLATKYAYFRAFRRYIKDRVLQLHAPAFWALSEDLKFAHDDTPFVPKEGDKFLVSCCGLDWQQVSHPEEQAPFFLFVQDDGQPPF